MVLSIRSIAGFAIAFAIASFTNFGALAADDTKPIDKGKGADYKSSTHKLKEKGEYAILLSFEAGEKFEAATGVGVENAMKKTHVHLFVYDDTGKEVAKDTPKGPRSEVKVTPAKAGKYKVVIKNVMGEEIEVAFVVLVVK